MKLDYVRYIDWFTKASPAFREISVRMTPGSDATLLTCLSLNQLFRRAGYKSSIYSTRVLICNPHFNKLINQHGSVPFDRPKLLDRWADAKKAHYSILGHTTPYYIISVELTSKQSLLVDICLDKAANFSRGLVPTPTTFQHTEPLIPETTLVAKSTFVYGYYTAFEAMPIPAVMPIVVERTLVAWDYYCLVSKTSTFFK